jgi:AAA domain-containing protein
LRDALIASADVVVTTALSNNTAHDWIGRSSNFDTIIVDEAGKASEPQVWNVLASYNPRIFLQVGIASPPFCRSSSVREQLGMSLFMRLHKAGSSP